MQKDFQYLKNPCLLPKAYEQSLLEIKRRRKFRKILDETYNKMKQSIENEANLRSQFMNEYGKILPSEFIPQFRDTIMNIKLEGSSKEYELPELEEEPGDVMGSINLENNSEYQKKVFEI